MFDPRNNCSVRSRHATYRKDWFVSTAAATAPLVSSSLSRLVHDTDSLGCRGGVVQIPCLEVTRNSAQAGCNPTRMPNRWQCAQRHYLPYASMSRLLAKTLSVVFLFFLSDPTIQASQPNATLPRENRAHPTPPRPASDLLKHPPKAVCPIACESLPAAVGPLIDDILSPRFPCTPFLGRRACLRWSIERNKLLLIPILCYNRAHIHGYIFNTGILVGNSPHTKL